MRRTPALIVGGGPAGSTAALLLARAGLPHLLLERQREIADSICGGFLSWRTLETLSALGVDPDRLNRVRVTRVRILTADRAIESRLPRPALGVSRRRLDTELLARARAAGAAIASGVAVRGIDDGVARLADGALIAHDALFLATGKHDLRGLARDAQLGSDPMLGLRIRAPGSRALDRLVGDAIELHLFNGGYAGIVLQEDGANICLALRRSRLIAAGGPAALLEQLARTNPRLGERLALAAGPVDAIANVPYGWRAARGAVGRFRLGDQAAVIASLAGEGMGIALASSARAVQAYRRGGPDAAPGFQSAFARAARKPLTTAGVATALATAPIASWFVGAAAPVLPLLARLTRIASTPLDVRPPATEIAA